MTRIQDNIGQIRHQIQTLAQACGRDATQVQLLAVSKTRPAQALREAYACGQTAFGENYLQEALDKIEALRDLPLEWHFIGPIQSNKTRPIAEHFDWVHSVDRLKIAKRLSEQRPADMPPLNICLQVNISREESKSGCMPDEVPELIAQIAALPNLTLRGLMAIPAATEDEAQQRAAFAELRQLLEAQQAEYPQLDTLSMGMSGDMPQAIAEGATQVRIGTAIFGARDYS